MFTVKYYPTSLQGGLLIDPILLPQSPAQLPPSLSRLWELAHNLWWSWNPDARGPFETLDRTLWKLTSHNSVKLLRQLSPERAGTASTDPAFLRRYQAVLLTFDTYMSAEDTWFARQHPRWRTASSRISPLNSACTSPCPSTAAVWASCPVTTARKPATWASPWSASGSCTLMATFASVSLPTAGSKPAPFRSSPPTRRSAPPSSRMASA